LFSIFKAFIKPQTYNGQVRHLLKLFLESIKPVICYITHFNEHTFYLTTLESNLKSRTEKDTYDLKALAGLLLRF
jgi:hypothetical protein